MVSRPTRARISSQTASSGKPQLTFANLLVKIEAFVRVFARPLLIAGGFLALAWLGLFAALFPWAHLVALVLFVFFFFESLGRARREWKPVPFSLALRRVEEASGLAHRPLDTIADRPVTADEDQLALWRVHAARAQEQVKNLRWPRWKESLAENDPYALRYALLVLLMAGVLSGWGALGGRLIAAINPALGKFHMTRPALDAWITPPEYTHLAPIMIATPAGSRNDEGVIDVPAGSTISAHLAERDGAAPELAVNDTSTDFTSENDRDFESSATITSGDSIKISRGWDTLGSWRIRVVPDTAPQIAFAETPSATERKTLRIPYTAKDDYGVTGVSLRVVPRQSLPGADNSPSEMALTAPDSKDAQRVAFEDLNSSPWAGLPVQLQLVATDAAGQTAQSEPVEVVLPERLFFQPIARALIEERKKLLLTPFDEAVRTEAANIMAGIAHQPASFSGDPVVMMALRAGAVRLVLDRDRTATASVNDILWQAAVRIEDGTIGVAEQNLRQAQKELADALDHNASEKDVQKLIDRLHQALAQYLAELSMRMAQRPGPVEDLSQLLGPQTNVLTPQDIERMLEQMRSLSAAGSRDAARQELAKLQQLMENLQTERQQLSPEQRAGLAQLKNLRALAHDQKQLLDKTFQNAQAGAKKDNSSLASSQNDLLKRLREMLGGMKEGGKEGTKAGAENLEHGADAMQRAGNDLKTDQSSQAVEHQNEALEALQQAEDKMLGELRQSLFMMPQPGMGTAQGSDPFGRDYSGMFRDDGSVKVPDQMEVRHVREILDELQRRSGDMARPKVERDYIERLLQNF